MHIKHIGKTCPYCQYPLKSESIIAVCTDCSMPHHIECWRENDGCSTLGCNGELYQEDRPSETDFNLQFEEGTAPLLPEHLCPGTILQNRYQIGKALGQGKYGITYLAVDKNLDFMVAIKEYFPKNLTVRVPENAGSVTHDQEKGDDFNNGLTLFEEEAKKLARLPAHPNIASVNDLFQQNGTAYMVMNYFDGISLEKYLIENGGRLSFDRVNSLLNPILEALQLMHEEGILHLDISPQAILIDRANKVLLINFSMAKYNYYEKLGNLSEVINSGFAPVEQYLSKGKKGPWSDIYAYAATLYSCVTGQKPPEVFDRMDDAMLATPTELRAKIRSRQEKILLKAMAINAAERYRRVEELHQDLNFQLKINSDLIKIAVENLDTLKDSKMVLTAKSIWFNSRERRYKLRERITNFLNN